MNRHIIEKMSTAKLEKLVREVWRHWPSWVYDMASRELDLRALGHHGGF